MKKKVCGLKSKLLRYQRLFVFSLLYVMEVLEIR